MKVREFSGLQSPFTSHIDDLPSPAKSLGLRTAISFLFVSLTIIGAKINLHIWEVPFTLQTVAVYGSGLFLGWQYGFVVQLFYLCLGIFFPVFAEPNGYGLEFMLTRVSSGYLLIFPFVASVTGFFSRKWNSFVGSALSMEIGSIVLFMFGSTWLYFALDLSSWWEALWIGWIKFIPADIAKILLTALIYNILRKRFKYQVEEGSSFPQ